MFLVKIVCHIYILIKYKLTNNGCFTNCYGKLLVTRVVTNDQETECHLNRRPL